MRPGWQYTDKYELTMLSTLISDGLDRQSATFEMFARRLPAGRRFGMLAGLGRFLEALPHFTFNDDDLKWLINCGALNVAAARKLEGWTFNGTISAYREGDLYWPYSPVLTVEGTLGDALILETLALSIFNHDTAIASAAARMVLAANGRPLIEMGSRRTHEDAAIAVARAAYLAGFASTSNLGASARYGIPVTGTAAHAFILAHTSEVEAFRAQIAAHGTETTLLVDTYDTNQGIINAVEAARQFGVAGPGAIRIDSGDLVIEAAKARALLDQLGATKTRIVATSDLDEFVLSALAEAPIDTYGVGTRVATGSGHPTAGFVYKLVEVNGRPVAKKSASKASVAGRKTAYRTPDGSEIYTLNGQVPDGCLALQQVVVDRGVQVGHITLEESRQFAAYQLGALSAVSRAVADGEPEHIATWEGQA